MEVQHVLSMPCDDELEHNPQQHKTRGMEEGKSEQEEGLGQSNVGQMGGQVDGNVGKWEGGSGRICGGFIQEVGRVIEGVISR